MEIVIWGEGRELENFIFEIEKNHKDVSVKCVVADGDYYFLKRYMHMTEKAFFIRREFEFDGLIVIAAPDNEYLEKKTKMIRRGYKEFESFIGYKFFGKKLCVINANCYMLFIKRYLNENPAFRMNYGIYPLPPIHENQDGCIDENVLAHADLFIHQDIRKGNAYGYKLADEYTLSKLKPGCQNICIPNFVGMLDGFYPTLTSMVYYNAANAPMFNNDWLIDEAHSRYGNNIGNVMFYISSYYFDKEEICNGFNAMVSKWRAREQNWDIKIVDFILENYKEKYLFEDNIHPAAELQNEICRRLLEKLGVPDINSDKNYSMSFNAEMFIWPQVKNILGMTWKKDRIRMDTVYACYHDGQPITLKQYVEEYIWRVFGH